VASSAASALACHLGQLVSLQRNDGRAEDAASRQKNERILSRAELGRPLDQLTLACAWAKDNIQVNAMGTPASRWASQLRRSIAHPGGQAGPRKGFRINWGDLVKQAKIVELSTIDSHSRFANWQRTGNKKHGWHVLTLFLTTSTYAQIEMNQPAIKNGKRTGTAKAVRLSRVSSELVIRAARQP
jgi:hypothetical protein